MRTRSTHFTLALVAVATMARAQESSTIQNWGAPAIWGLAGAAIPTGPLQFVGITPCRLLDTRGAGFTGPWGPPLLASGVARNFPIAGQCGIPSNAQAVSANLGVTLTEGAGFLLIHPQGGAMPLVSSINYERSGQTIANAAVIPLGEEGGITVVAGVSSTQFFMDVNGYYAPQAVVTNVNGVSGELTLVAGANVTLTPSGDSITISSTATGVAGPQGPAGPQGANGLQGLQGPAGPQGPGGPQGLVGSQGPAGPQGLTGLQGPQGDPGPAGPVGATWRSNWDGATSYAPGDIVALGGASYIALAANAGTQPDLSLGTSWDLVAARGIDGTAGPAGATGAVGPSGPVGATGATGAMGPQGAVGVTGAQGVKGDTGDVGPQGPVGATGATGATGAMGPQGPVGATGAQGPQGVPGTSAALVGGNHPNVNDGEFLMPWDITQNATESSEDVPVSAGTANKLIFRMGTVLTSGQTATITLRKNGVDTLLTCTIPNSGSSCTDYSHTVTYADGDSLSIKYNETGSTKPAGRVKYSFLYATQ